MLQIKPAENSPPDLVLIKTMFREYAAQLNVDLGFQNFDQELEDPFINYGPPSGALLVAYINNEPAGCIAFKKINDAGVCEMKRLYVRPVFRNLGIGEALVEALLKQAINKGYTSMVLDTLERLRPALLLYKKYGFKETAAYYQNPLPGVVYMQKIL